MQPNALLIRQNFIVVKSRCYKSSKDFEVRGILEKESESNGPNSYQADRHDYLPEVKREILV
jgi:hypothetical protein